METVTILCAQKNSVYRNFPCVDIFDAQRDAYTFTGAGPVVAHPPCGQWSAKLAHFVRNGDAMEKNLGLFCADLVKKNGGILEHPTYSRLFAAANLPEPGQPHPDGFTVAIPQHWFGHPCLKESWFFVSGISQDELPEIPLVLESPTRRLVEKMSKHQREATPPALAAWLIETARRCAGVTA